MKKIKVVIFLLILFCPVSWGQPFFNPEDYIRIINLVMQNKIDIVKQELLAKNYIIKKDIPLYHYGNQIVKFDLEFEYPYNDINLKDFTPPSFCIRCTEEGAFSKTLFGFMNLRLCPEHTYIFNKLKEFMKYQLHVNNLSDNTMDNCWGITSIPQKIFPSFDEYDFDITTVELLQMECILNSGFSSLTLTMEYYQKNSTISFGKTKIPLRNVGNINIITVEIGGRKFDYMIDSGASYITITPEIEKYLTETGVIRTSDYSGKTEAILADGSTNTYKKVTIPIIKIGNIKLENIETVIINNGSLLLGKSVLDRFKGWKIDNITNQLIIE